MNRKSLLLLLIIPYILIRGIDLLNGENDGVINGWYFSRIFLRVSILAMLVGVVYFFSKSKSSAFLRLIMNNILVFFVFCIALELISAVYLRYFAKDATLPSYSLIYDNPAYPASVDRKTLLWGDLVDSVGRWRVPDSHFTMVNCEDSSEFTYDTNSLGLRDIERDTDDTARVAFIGDSFIEGYMVPAEVRVSNRLEKASGVPHINFGIAGVNPLAYYFIYKKIAKPNYAHNRVMVGICQINDFEHFNHPLNADFLNVPIYRGYWNEDGVHYTLADRSHSITSLNKSKNYLRNTRDSLYATQSFARKLNLEFRTNTHLANLVYYFRQKIAQKKFNNEEYKSHYEQPHWDTPETFEFTKSLDALVKEIGNKPTLFLIIPDKKDIRNYKKNKINHYVPYLAHRYPSVKIVDLLPLFAELDNPDAYFISCDGHWNDAGHQLVTDYLMNNSDYRAFMGFK